MRRGDIFQQESYDDLNVTPLLDLAWTLLVVFIIVVTANVQGIRVDLPKASDAPSLDKPKTKAITITDSGQIYLDAYPVTINELEQKLGQYKAQVPDLPVIIKGDARVFYGKVIQVLDVVQRLNITQLGLVTQDIVK
jgi:biopolymer transport protein ExbD